MELLNIKDIDLENKKVFIRCDFNVPLDEFGNITDDRRIRSALSTIRFCHDHKAAIILATHLGRPKKKFNFKYSVRPIQKRLHTLLQMNIKMAKDIIGEDAKNKVKNLKSGEILLLENLRFEPGEEQNDDEFAKQLADFADVYINNAFGVSHRNHASVSKITKYFSNDNKGAGFLLQKEITFFSQLLTNPARPFTAIVGGSKVSSKLEALKNLLPKVDKLIIGGGMAFTFLKALGEDVGQSIAENDLIPEAKNIMAKAKKLGVQLYLPIDVVVSDKFGDDGETKVVTIQEIPKKWRGLDIGPATVKLFQLALRNSHTILWNGPMGVYEIEKFSRGSLSLLILLQVVLQLRLLVVEIPQTSSKG